MNYTLKENTYVEISIKFKKVYYERKRIIVSSIVKLEILNEIKVDLDINFVDKTLHNLIINGDIIAVSDFKEDGLMYKIYSLLLDKVTSEDLSILDDYNESKYSTCMNKEVRSLKSHSKPKESCKMNPFNDDTF